MASARELHAIAGAKAKTDRRDARMLAKLLAAGMLEGTWLPGEETRTLRRRLAQRAQLVRARTRLKNEVHAALYRNLVGAPSATDLFGAAGRRWLEHLELPVDERETLESCLRTIAFLDGEVERFEQAIARCAMHSPEIRRLVTIPGVGLISAATLVAVVGNVRRFRSARKLVGYLGLDPRVRQSGSSPARMGHISKEGPAAARQALCEAAHAAMRTPGPLRAFRQRVAARRGCQVAIVAVARKLATIAWRLLTSGEDYAFASPGQVRLKLRRIELAAGAPRQQGHRTGVSLESQQERELALTAERAYQRLVADWQAAGRGRAGAGAAVGRASDEFSLSPAARQTGKPQVAPFHSLPAPASQAVRQRRDRQRVWPNGCGPARPLSRAHPLLELLGLSHSEEHSQRLPDGDLELLDVAKGVRATAAPDGSAPRGER